MQRQRVLLLFSSVVTLTLTALAFARAEEAARQVLDRYKALDAGERRWTERQGRLKITTSDPLAGGRVVELMAYQRRSPGDETKTALLVRAPGDLKGAGVLTVTHGNGPGEQWRYRPDGDKLEPIDATSGNEPVLHSDLTFHDLALLDQLMLWPDADAHATLRGEEGIDSVATYAIEFEPRRADTAYRKIVLWLGLFTPQGLARGER